MERSKSTENRTSDVLSAEEGPNLRTSSSMPRAAPTQLQQWNRLLQWQVAERTRELERSRVNLRALAAELNLAEQRERTCLATDLHDYLAQLLALGKLTLGRAKRTELPPQAEQLISETEGTLTDALTYCHTLMAELSPPGLQEMGLAAGLHWLVDYMKRYDLDVTIEVDQVDECSIPEGCAVLLFRSVRELLINTVKHAAVKQATIHMTCEKGLLQIIVGDESGVDLAASAAASPADMGSVLSSKFGLHTIRQRMTALGGRFAFESSPTQGTTATLTLPIDLAD
jgi:signal transduction histidine kinase